MITARGWVVGCDGFTVGVWEYDANDLPPDECVIGLESSAGSAAGAWEDALRAGWTRYGGQWELCPWCSAQVGAL